MKKITWHLSLIVVIFLFANIPTLFGQDVPQGEQPALHTANLPELGVSENSRFLVMNDGQPFFWLGDTAWELFHRLTREEADRYLENRAGNGFTVIQAVALAELDGLIAPNPYGNKPLIENDPSRPDLKEGPDNDYWDHVDYIVNKANSLGMMMGFLPTWGDKWNKKWGVGPEIFTPQNAEVYGEWLGKRYRDAGIIWILGGDRPVENEMHLEIVRAMARGLAKGDGGRHLMTYHPMGGQTSSTDFHEDDWLDFNMLQSGHSAESTNYVPVEADYALTPPKPVLDGEPAYEYPPDAMPEKRPVGALQVRRNAYWSVFAGAFGHTYGTHPIWQMYDKDRKPLWDVVTPWHQALDLPGATQLVHLKNLMLSRPFLTRIPDQSLILSSIPEGVGRIQATRGGETDQKNATYIMVYFPEHQQVTLNTGCIPAATIMGWWYNPRSGEVKSLGELPNNGTQEFEPPTHTEGEDWVLVLDDATKSYPKPGHLVVSGQPISSAPEVVSLDNLENFEAPSGNWQLVEEVAADPQKDHFFNVVPGKGILLNIPTGKNDQNLVTAFEHGDIELELEYMVPKGSNSGVYLQGRYEVQIFDSWGVKEQKHSDAGGIYQRWDEARNQGFEGHPARENVSKAPGEWQHFKIIFEAPRFNEVGEKTKNAKFVQVYHNGTLIHENVEVTGPTRAAQFDDEKAQGPLMLQGDHGPVAFRNIKFKNQTK